MRAPVCALIFIVAAACTYSVPEVVGRGDPDGGGAPDDSGVDARVDIDGASGDAAADATFPGSLEANLLLHARAEDLTLADGANVTSWSDIAGNNFVFVQSETASMPKFRPRIGTEPSAVDFFQESTHLALSTTASASFRFAAGVAFTAVVVFRTSVQTTERWEQLFGNEFAGTSTRIGFVLEVDSTTGHPDFGVRNGCNGGCLSVVGKTDVHDGKWHWMGGVRDGDAARLYVDGLGDGELTSGAGVSIEGADDIRVGASRYNALPYVGRVAEVFVWRRGLSAADLGALDAHLRAKFPIAR